MKGIFEVVSQGEAFIVPSNKTESGHTFKSIIVLKEIVGKHANTFAAAMIGNKAQCKFYERDLVAAALKFSIHEHNGQTYQDVLVEDIYKLKSC
jgi:hypothetical protein